MYEQLAENAALFMAAVSGWHFHDFIFFVSVSLFISSCVFIGFVVGYFKGFYDCRKGVN